jgi:hypothetical protein
MAGALAGCAHSMDRTQRNATPASPLHRDADRIALELCSGRVGALYHLEDVGELNAPDIVLTLDGMKELFDRCDLDPRRDLTRAFGVASETFSSDGITVLEHALTPDRLAAVFADVGGHPVTQVFPAAQSTIAGVERIVAAPEPHLLVVAPSHHAHALGRFMGTGLPGARAGEMAFWFSDQPSASVDGNFFPATLQRAELETTIDRRGAAKVRFVALSINDSQARLDAEALTAHARDAISVDIGAFRLSLFDDRVTFRAEAAKVIGETRLSPDEVRWIVAVLVHGIPI